MEDAGPLCLDCSDLGDYDELLMSGIDRQTAREHVRDRVEEILTAWRDGIAMLDS